MDSPRLAEIRRAAKDYTGYLNLLQQNGHNFIRCWRWELFRFGYSDKSLRDHTPQPWPRTGPGVAKDGKLKFDLNDFDPAFFDLLRSRAVAARDRGIYFSIMLFEGHGVQASKTPWRWDGHPYNVNNNINGINGDDNGDGQGVEIHRQPNAAVLANQQAYVRKVIDTVNDLDNILYEIANEAGTQSTTWQHGVLDYVKTYQAGKPKQHPVGMTFPAFTTPSNAGIFSSSADWISPGEYPPLNDGYASNPPAADGRKVSIPDTDHIHPFYRINHAAQVNDEAAYRAWVWKSFLRGHNPILMDHDRSDALFHAPGLVAARAAMGHTRTYANKLNLAAMKPHNTLASTGYCLANPGKEYLVYLPDGGEVAVDLSAAKGTLAVERFSPRTGSATNGGMIEGGAKRTLRAAFEGDAALYVRKK